MNVNININLKELSEYSLTLLHDFVLEAFGLTGKYSEHLADIEHEIWWREHEMDTLGDE